jgi:hypothetical protein
MKACLKVGFCLVLIGMASTASAQIYISPVTRYPLPYAPGTYGTGFYTICPDGTAFGPNYCVYPPFPPVSGIRPCFAAPNIGFPSHPFARSPRDFFMWSEMIEERIGRERRPPIVP